MLLTWTRCRGHIQPLPTRPIVRSPYRALTRRSPPCVHCLRQVDIVDVRPSDDDSGKYEIVYQITDIEPTAQIAASNAIESDPVAEAVEAELVKAGFDDVDVAAADASVTFEEVIELPEAEADNEVAIVAQQVFVGLTPDDAADETFQEALAAAVAEEVSENTDAEVDPAQVPFALSGLLL